MSAENNKSGASKERKGLSRALKLFYGVGDCGFTLMSNVESYFFNVFLTNLAGFPLAVVTMITTISSAIDAGFPGSTARSSTVSNQRNGDAIVPGWFLLPWIVPFLYAFQFIKVGSGPVSIAVIIIAAVASHVVWNFPYVANVSMIAVAGKTPEERAQLSSTRAAWANLSKVIFSYVATPLAALFAGFIGETNKYGAVAFVLGCVMAFLYFAHFKMFDGYEKVETVTKDTAKKDKDKTSGMDLLKALGQNPPLIMLLLSDLANGCSTLWCGSCLLLFHLCCQRRRPAGYVHPDLKYLLCCGSYLQRIWRKSFPPRNATIYTFFAMAIVILVANFTYTNVWLVIILMSVAQFGYGIAYACTPALYADTIIYSEWKTGKNATGWISGLQNVPLKIGVMTRGIIITGCLAMANFSKEIDPAAASEGLQKGICVAFMVIPAIALVVAAVLLMFGFRLTKDKVEKYQAEIAARKAA